ncbi:NADPH-dependent FMN reductase [Paenibacillus sp. MBLB4367]|uniref:NADPH-dependent FMN reductase n=1 Tax=Paenibacillus sp. MBLB4367 TaxID=3384767 RepID=UPI003908077B
MKITIVAGSNRKQSTSTKLCRYIASVLRTKEIDVTLFDLYEKPLPFYDPSRNEETDPNVLALIAAVRVADAVVLSTPDYHGSVSGVMKNALDYLGFDEFDSKAVLAVSSSGGAVGVSPLTHLQTMVRNLHGINCPEWISIGGENRAFTPEGDPANEKVKERVNKVLGYFVKLALTLRKAG